LRFNNSKPQLLSFHFTPVHTTFFISKLKN
jgi:hypothetical protein